MNRGKGRAKTLALEVIPLCAPSVFSNVTSQIWPYRVSVKRTVYMLRLLGMILKTCLPTHARTRLRVVCWLRRLQHTRIWLCLIIAAVQHLQFQLSNWLVTKDLFTLAKLPVQTCILSPFVGSRNIKKNQIFFFFIGIYGSNPGAVWASESREPANLHGGMNANCPRSSCNLEN